jgi:hypothetical protein
MFQHLFDDILLLLLEYMNDYDTQNLMRISDYVKKLYNKNGYLKCLSVGHNLMNNDISKFAMLCAQHDKSLQILDIAHTNNPQHWIFCKWPKKIFLNYCTLTDKIDPPTETKTEELHITCHNIINNRKKKLQINWKKFPNLKSLYIEAYDVDLEGLEKCQKLVNKKIKIIGPV